MSVINTNYLALVSQSHLQKSQSALGTAIERLSSGLRINSAKDDAAGFAIAERFLSNIRGLSQVARDTSDGVSLAQTAQGALSATNDSLQRMRELAVQASNATNSAGSAGDIAKLDNEYKQLGAELSRMLDATQFNGEKILNGSASYVFQVGANAGAENQITIANGDISLSGNAAFSAVASGGASATLITGTASANTANIAALDAAISAVNDRRASLGALQSRFENTISYLRTASENQSAARGRIMDADFAAETANLSRTQVLQQAGTAMIAQANQAPQQVLALLR